MPVDLHVIRASDFVCLDPDEVLDFAASQRALQTLAHACRKRGLESALLDLRAIPIPSKPVFTPTQLAALIDTFRAAGFGPKQRLAMLYKYDPHGGVRTFAFIGRIQHLQVRAFDEFEAAFHWLAEETRPAERRENEIPIPIHQRKKEAKKLPVGVAANLSSKSAARPAHRAPHKPR